MFYDIRECVSQPQVQTRLQTIGTWIAVLYAGWSLWTTRKIAKDNEKFLNTQQQRTERFHLYTYQLTQIMEEIRGLLELSEHPMFRDADEKRQILASKILFKEAILDSFKKEFGQDFPINYKRYSKEELKQIGRRHE